MVGNDLVYLKQWPKRQDRKDRLYPKLFTERERQWLSEQEERTRAEAQLWCAKEAVYKAEVQLGATRGFYPKKIAGIEAAAGKYWQGPTRRWYCRWQRWGAYLHCYAVPVGLSANDRLNLTLLRGSEASLRIHAMVRSTYRSAEGIPCCYQKNCWASKSHDGLLTVWLFLKVSPMGDHASA